jgi:hypothetical protein
LKSKHKSEIQSQLREKQNKFNYIIKEYNENLIMEWDKLINSSNNEDIMSINQLIQKIRLKSKADTGQNQCYRVPIGYLIFIVIFLHIFHISAYFICIQPIGYPIFYHDKIFKL